jgi:hypothetical protein
MQPGRGEKHVMVLRHENVCDLVRALHHALDV